MITVSADEPLMPPVPDENPFVVTPVRATWIPPPAPAARPSAPQLAVAESAAAVVAVNAPASSEADDLAAVAELVAEPPVEAPEPTFSSAMPDGEPVARQEGATVHVLAPKPGAPRPRLALAVNDAPLAPEPTPQTLARPAPAPRRSVVAVPAPPEQDGAPPRRHAVPVVLAAVLGIALGGAFVGVLLLRDRHPSGVQKTVETAVAAPAPVPSPVPLGEATSPSAAPSPAPPVAVTAPPASPPDPLATPQPRTSRRATSAFVERRADPAAPAEPRKAEAVAAASKERPPAPAAEAPAPAAVAAAEPVAASAPAAPPPAMEDAPKAMGSQFRAPQLVDKKCIVSNLSLPEPVEGGAVTVRLAVSATGVASQVQILGTSDPQVADAIRHAVGRCAWTPGADAEGHPTSLWVVQRIRFAQ